MRRRPWHLPDAAITDEAAYLSRRRFLKALGLGGLAAGALSVGGRSLLDAARAQDDLVMPALGATKNDAFQDAGRALTPGWGGGR